MNTIDELLIYYDRGEIESDEIIQNIDTDTDINCLNYKCITLLMMACRNTDAILVSYLIEAGANINLRNKAGTTALAYACMYCKTFNGIDCISKLLDAGANADITLHYKSEIIDPHKTNFMVPYRFVKCCKYDTIKNCTDLTLNEDRCESPLILLIMNTKMDASWHDILMRLILSSDVLYQDVAGKTAYDYFIQLHADKEILSENELFLLKYGKRFNRTKSARC